MKTTQLELVNFIRLLHKYSRYYTVEVWKRSQLITMTYFEFEENAQEAYENLHKKVLTNDEYDGCEIILNEVEIDKNYNELKSKLVYMDENLSGSFDVDHVAKRIARLGEFDNGHILFNYNKMTSADAEEKARQMSIKYPTEVFYVSYNDVMNPRSEISWKNGKEYKIGNSEELKN